jgi:phospholipase C
MPEPTATAGPAAPAEPAGPSRRAFIGGSAAAVGSLAAATMLPAGTATAATTRLAAGSRRARTVKDVKHVVILMQENRSFDHYYGSLGGVRGFGDKQHLVYPDATSIFQQPDHGRAGTPFLKPWHMDTRQYDAQEAGDLDHSWSGTHTAWTSGAWNRWVAAKGEETMGYLTRTDIPWQYALADAYTVCDSYFCSIQGPTTPNRLFQWTGTINPQGGAGGPALDNPADYNPVYRWTTYPERLQAAGVSWQVYANDEVGDGDDGWVGDYGDNPLWLFQAYHDALASTDPATRQLATRASLRDAWKPDSGQGHDVSHVLSQFIADCAAGSIPTVSWVVAPYSYSEHPSARPVDGAHYTDRVVKALASNKELWESTVLLINYDENDGFFDHALPPTPPVGTPDEFVSGLPIGLGPRVPMTVVSPWSRGGWVNSQVFDHTSVIRFLEVVTGVHEPNISAWRRAVCGDLTSCLDFTRFDPSRPTLPDPVQLVAIADAEQGLPAPVPPVGTQGSPITESTTRRQRPLPYQPNVSVTVDRITGKVSAAFTNTGQAAMSFAVYPNIVQPFVATPVLVSGGGSGSYVWASAPTGAYDFTVHGPNGFLRRFTGAVVPAGQNDIGVPSVVASVSGRKLTLTLANAGDTQVRFSLMPNDFAGLGMMRYVKRGKPVKVVWPLEDGWYDVTVTANTGTGFSYRFAGRIEPAR